MFKYKMVQVPPTIPVEMKNHKGNEAAMYLENIVAEYTSQGWEFYRIDSIGVSLQPGCLGGIFGKKEENTQYHVITFRMKS